LIKVFLTEDEVLMG